MIPTDIETGIQWRVRHMTPDGARELTRHGNETQVKSIAQRMGDKTVAVEARFVEVHPWGDPETVVKQAEASGEEPDDDGD